MPRTPLCYLCTHRRNVPGSAHSSCANTQKDTKVRANPHGIKMGWFMWPINFDPTWLDSCSGYTPHGPLPPETRDETRVLDGLVDASLALAIALTSDDQTNTATDESTVESGGGSFGGGGADSSYDADSSYGSSE